MNRPATYHKLAISSGTDRQRLTPANSASPRASGSMDRPPPSFIPPDLSVPRGYTLNLPPDHLRWEATHKYRNVSQRLQEAVERVSARIPVNRSSRVVRWIGAIEKLWKADKRGVLVELAESLRRGEVDHPYRDSFIAVVESRTFVEIITQLGEHLSDSQLRELVLGHPDPALDGPSARARNKDFEWFIAALCRRAGLPVALAEPDVLVEYRGSTRAIAAKRIYGRNQLEKNVRSATYQIAREGYPGFVFLDVTRYINPDMKYTEHWRDEHATVGSRMNALTKLQLITTRRSPLVEGVFLRAAFPHIAQGFEFGTAESWSGINLGENNEYTQHFLHTLSLSARQV